MVITPSILAAVGLGGAIGSISRLYIGVQIARQFPQEIPIATLLVNTIGSFFIGVLTALFLYYTPSDTLRVFLVTGFLGSLTTYSTFAIESYMLLNSNFLYGVSNILLNVIGSIICAAIGYKLLLYILK